MMKRSLLGIVTVAGCVVFAALALSCETTEAAEKETAAPIDYKTPIVYKEIPFAELATSIENVDSPGQGFIVEAYYHSRNTTNDKYKIAEQPGSAPSQWLLLHMRDADQKPYLKLSSLYYFPEPPQFRTYSVHQWRLIEKTKRYRFFIGLYYSKDGRSLHPFIDEIEGLMTAEEALNPKNVDRSLYKETTVENFSFDMVSGRLAPGTKVTFPAYFLIKPTGTNYRFKDIDAMITMSTDYNFLPYLIDNCFPFQGGNQITVRLYITVNQPGQSGECSIDIVRI